MTITGTPPTNTLSSPPPVRPRRVALTAAAGLVALAAVGITPWLLSSGPRTEANSIGSTSAAAAPQQLAPALDPANAGRNAGSIAGPAAYTMFCQNSPSLCVPPAPTLATGYLKFCGNSPTLCVLPKRN